MPLCLRRVSLLSRVLVDQAAVIAGNEALLRLLLDEGADATRTDAEGHTAVHWATGEGGAGWRDVG